MIFFIIFLRALAACIITNSHYTGIYPTDLIANGGAIGDVLFFAVSGYCLYNVKYELNVSGFLRWYGKRIWRVYPPVIIMTAIYMALGLFQFAEHGFVWWYIYPTHYHFVASIILLYIPFFFIMKVPFLQKRLLWIMIGIAIAWLVVYFTIYDRSYFHNTVREPMTRFLFMESMLLGAWFRKNDQRLRNKFHIVFPVMAIAAFSGYVAGMLLFSKRENLAPFQFLNQIVLFVLLFSLFRIFCGIDERLEKIPKFAKNIITFLSEMTLEIYVVQSVIIEKVRNLNLVFPLNWLLLTASILLIAFVLHKICELIYKPANKLLK